MQEKLTTEYLMIAKRKMESQKVPGPYFVFCDEETAKELKEMGFKEYTWDVLPEPFNNYFVLYEITGIKLEEK